MGLDKNNNVKHGIPVYVWVEKYPKENAQFIDILFLLCHVFSV